jgi:hypothetical protein
MPQRRYRIPAAVTWYNGIQFRSRAEARLALFMDMLPGVKWIYESRNVQTSLGGYMPDFEILQPFQGFIEVKPTKPKSYEQQKCLDTSRQLQVPVWIFFGDLGLVVQGTKKAANPSAWGYSPSMQTIADRTRYNWWWTSTCGQRVGIAHLGKPTATEACTHSTCENACTTTYIQHAYDTVKGWQFGSGPPKISQE